MHDLAMLIESTTHERTSNMTSKRPFVLHVYVRDLLTCTHDIFRHICPRPNIDECMSTIEIYTKKTTTMTRNALKTYQVIGSSTNVHRNSYRLLELMRTN
jgi:hypothetical protein